MSTRNKTPFVIAIVLVVVAVVAIAAVLAAGGDDDDGDPGATESTGALPDELAGEVRPVTVEGTALPLLQNPNNDAAVGLAAPVLDGEGFDGSTITTASADGPVLLVFVAHWCPHCNSEIPRLLALDDEGRFPDDLTIIGISTGVSAEAPNFPPSEWAEELGWRWPMMADGIDLTTGTYVGAEAFGVNAFPFITVVGADGNVRARWTGESEPDDFIARLDAALAT